MIGDLNCRRSALLDAEEVRLGNRENFVETDDRESYLGTLTAGIYDEEIR